MQMKDLVFHQVKIDQTSPNLDLIIGAVTDRDLVATIGAEIEVKNQDLVVTIGAEIEVKNQDLVVISLRLVQETVEQIDPNSAEQIVEQIVLSLAAIINLEIGVTNRGLAQIVEGEIDPNLAALETAMTDPNLEIHQGVFQTKTGHRLVEAQEGRSKNQVKVLPVATAMATRDLQVIEVIDQNLVDQKIALHLGVVTALRLIEKGDLTNQGLQRHTKETMLQNLEIGVTNRGLALITKVLTARDLVAIIGAGIEVKNQDLVVIAELVNQNLRGKKDNSTSLALSATTHLSLPKNSTSPR
jgi:hypothetical protein